MTTKYAQPMSPRTQNFMSGLPSGDEEERMFEDGFNTMAYNVLISKFPDLVQHVITFKVLETDVTEGAGAGAFVVQHGDEIIYIPVIMADNQVKPVDLFYHKGLNVFLPLNKDWLDEVSQLTLDEMGQTMTQPTSLRRDVDTRNLMIPPTTGRYAYAGKKEKPTDDVINMHLVQLLEHLQTEKTAADYVPVLPRFLADAPRNARDAFVNVVTTRPKLAAQLVTVYGEQGFNDICSALEKTAAAEPKTNVDEEGELNIVDNKATANTFKDVFGARAPEAFQGMLRKGYAANDTRQGLKAAVQVQTPKDLTEPQESGFYRVYDKNGKTHEALVLHNVRDIRANFGMFGGGKGAPEGRHGKRHDTLGHGSHNKDFLVVMKGGLHQTCGKLVGTKLEEPDTAAMYSKLMEGEKGDTPTTGSKGIFVKKTGNTFVATTPFEIERVSTDKDGIKRIVTDRWDKHTLVLDPKASKASMHQPKGSNIMFIPTDARFIRLKKRNYNKPDPTPELMEDATSVCQWFSDKFDSMGASSIAVKNASANQFSVDGETPRTMLDAMKHAALKHRIHFDEAEELVKRAAALPNGQVRAYVLTEEMLEKVAQTPMMDPSSMAPAGAAPMPGGPPVDPSMQGAPPPAPPPSPLDIAMGEAQTQIQQQGMDLQQQQMNLEDKANTLATVQQRAQEIAMGGAEAVQMGAPPMPPMGGGAPAEGGAPPAPGGMPAPAPMAGPGGGMGSLMPGQQAGDPMAAQGTAMMATEGPSAMEMQNQLNPQFLEQAGALEDASAFDAAAIASMAQSPSFPDMVVDYVPTMERALDNLGRVMLSMWMQESVLKQQIGNEEYADLEDNVRSVFEGLGALILQMNRNAVVMDTPA